MTAPSDATTDTMASSSTMDATRIAKRRVPALEVEKESLIVAETVDHEKSVGQEPPTAQVHAALVLGQIFFGLGSVVAALGLPSCNPLAFALVREAIAGMLLLSADYWFHHRKQRDSSCRSPVLRNPTRFILLGLVIYGNQAGGIVGIKLAGPVAAAVWQPSQPILTAAISISLGWEPFNWS